MKEHMRKHAGKVAKFISPGSFLLALSLGIFLAFFLQTTGCSPAVAGDINRDALFSGKVTETGERLVVEGATFVVDGGDKPVVKIDKETKKEVILRNVRIVSRNQTISDQSDKNKGTAGIVAIDNSASHSKVSLSNVKLTARNANVSSVSQEADGCAALLCGKKGRYDSYRSVSAVASGKTGISATQGVRPDYRKTTK